MRELLDVRAFDRKEPRNRDVPSSFRRTHRDTFRRPALGLARRHRFDGSQPCGFVLGIDARAREETNALGVLEREHAAATGGHVDDQLGVAPEFELGGASEPYRRFERAALATAATSDPGEQMAAAWEAQRILLAEQVVSVPLFYPDRYLRKRAWFRGFSIDPFNFLDFTRLQFIPPEARP